MSAERASLFRRGVDRAAHVGVPLAVLAIVFAVLLGERMRIDHELHLVVPPGARPGTTLPVRAVLFGAFGEPGGPRLTSAPVEVRLLDAEGRVRVEGELAPSSGGAEGNLELPSDLRGRFAVRAIARVEGEPVASAETAVEVEENPPAAPMYGRMATALQVLELGTVRGSAPPAPFEVRVASGACVPEERCELLVHVGEPAAAVRVERSPSVTPVEEEEEEASGLVLLPVVVHGPEARAELVATRAGVEVGRRSLQLPVALATPALVPGPRIVPHDAPVALEARVLGEPAQVIADAYRGGIWTRTVSLGRGSLGPLAPGLWRIQVRTDPFSAERAAVATVLVRERGESEQAAVERALARALPREYVPSGPAALRLAWSAAGMERRVCELPEGVSGRAADEARVEARKSMLRIAALIALALGLIIAAVVFFRRGIGAALEAQRVMDATGDPALASATHRRRTFASALLLVSTLLLALLGAAALIVARAHLLG